MSTEEQYYSVAITTPKSFLQIKSMVKNRLEELELQFPYKQTGRSFALKSCFFLLQNHSESELGKKSSYPYGVLVKDDPYENPSVIVSIIKFLEDFFSSRVTNLYIFVGADDVEGFRIASFIASYCEKNNKIAVIQDTELKIVPHMHGPHVQDSSLKVLFSVIDFKLRTGKFPTHNDLREHFFNLTQTMFKEEESESLLKPRKFRKWTSDSDNKFVSSLYAAERSLKKQGLLVTKKDAGTRIIEEIKPTVNGLFAVMFSEVGKKLY